MVLGKHRVSIHAPTRGATYNNNIIYNYYGFQSTPPREGRQQKAIEDADSKRFQSTPPREGRHEDDVTGYLLKKFQSTPPREGRLSISLKLLSSPGFNPRPHARGDYSLQTPSFYILVSIHAPTRGATRLSKSFSLIRKCFNPRPHARGDIIRRSSRRRSRGFNPRPHARGDAADAEVTNETTVSIHAPTRGATISDCLPMESRKFQSTPPREGRRYYLRQY